MRVFHAAAEVPEDFGPSVVTIGNFDGVHKGHAGIMRRVVAIARERGLVPAVLTFDPHPARVLAPARAPKLIMTVPQRLRRLEQEGIEAVLVFPFSAEFAKLSPEEFAARILVKGLRARCVLVGEDFRFGFRQAGHIGTLRTLGERFGFELQPIPAITGGGERISSTRIRSLVGTGKVSRACRMMGAPFALEGPVVSGRGIGSKQTVPTLNLAPENELLPGVGVYATRTRDEGSGAEWRSITNVGYRPTFDGHGLTVETFLLDSPPPETPERIEVAFLAFVRGERKFAGPEELRAQILRDSAAVRRFHARIGRLRVG
ncbi:MAG: bifunctional riboflavin kinase/FAD synthetase [Acidobacteriota bacterium]|nr:bifunctional riboflavin kinase/FAD synthetase [Acidobacteriota bacterium]